MKRVLIIVASLMFIGCTSPIEKRLIVDYPHCKVERINSSSTSETYAIYCKGEFVKKETFFKRGN